MRVVETEFPDWEILRKFDVFALTEERKATASTEETDVAGVAARRASLEHLAKVFGVDHGALAAQYDTILPIARRFYLETGCMTTQAWRPRPRNLRPGSARQQPLCLSFVMP